jgi:serine/threonine-protein kinase
MGDTSSESRPVSRLLGQVLEDRYHLVQELGRGAMSIVYRAEQLRGPPVAVKVLHEELGNDPKLKERFEREARALFGLDHPNLLDVHDFGIVDGVPYLVMELLDGTPLDELFEEGPPDPQTAFTLMTQLLEGLAFAHQHGVLHRDLKAENVFVTRDAQGGPVAKILDFGLVKFVDEERWGSGGQALTSMGSVFGTPAYMAPEQVTGSAVDKRTDVYAAGVILFELFTGLWPFMEEERFQMFRAHLSSTPPSLGETRTDFVFRHELEQVLQTALAKKPEDRYEEAGAMLSALKAVPQPVASPAPGSAAHPAAAGTQTASASAKATQAAAADRLSNSAIAWFVLGAGGMAAVLVVGVVLAVLLL